MRRKTLTTILSLLMAAMMALTLAGCAQPAAEQPEPAGEVVEPPEATEAPAQEPEKTPAAEEQQESEEDVEEVTVDVAVIGGGASGTGAAAAAIDGGASVLMVEKNAGIGGISHFYAGGPFAVESHLQLEEGGEFAKITKEELFQAINEYARHINYAPLTKAIVEKSGDTIAWLETWGVTFHLNYEPAQISDIGYPIKYMLYHWYDLFSYDHMEKAAIDVVHENLAAKGLDLRLNTTATELLQDENGRVNGFVAEKKEGGKLIVHAKAVIVGTGGFAGDPEMMMEYYHTPNTGSFGEGGTGVKMAWAVGAAKWDTSSSLFHGAGMVSPEKPGEITLSTSAFSRIPRSPLMWIDQTGNRFCNEEVVWDVALTAAVAYSVGGKYYILVDTPTLEAYTEDKILRVDTAVGGPNWEKGDFVALAEEGVKQGIIVKADTLEELAQKLGMETERLLANVEEYNIAVETKEDMYGKTEESLVYPVKNGPFYAIKMQMSNLGTLGGVRVNEKLQATDVDLKPIPGLYVVGNDAAGFYGNTTTYPPYGGLATGFAWNSGRIAGENAALEAKK